MSTYYATGRIRISGCAGTDFKNNYFVAFATGSKVFVKKGARRGKFERVVIKRTNIVFPKVSYGITPAVMYVDTSNRVWSEEELVSEEDAVDMVDSYVAYSGQRRREYFEGEGCLPITPEGCG